MDCEQCNSPFWLCNDVETQLNFLEVALQGSIDTDEASREKKERLTQKLFHWRYLLESCRISFWKMLVHRFQTVQEATHYRSMIANLKPNEAVVTLDYASKLWAYRCMEPICAAAAGIASCHIACVFYLSPTAEIRSKYPHINWQQHQTWKCDDEEEGGLLSFFVNMFSRDTDQDAPKAFGEESALGALISQRAPWIDVYHRHSDGAVNYHSSLVIQWFSFALSGKKRLHLGKGSVSTPEMQQTLQTQQTQTAQQPQQSPDLTQQTQQTQQTQLTAQTQEDVAEESQQSQQSQHSPEEVQQAQEAFPAKPIDDHQSQRSWEVKQGAKKTQRQENKQLREAERRSKEDEIRQEARGSVQIHLCEGSMEPWVRGSSMRVE
ncbi:hypothetical protein B484DRAFT_472180 [Ochromonadaceae sp. CCMP2298]|nr:hypothetical protein B484DRAFT_472180 [Ochromonadaceae sp. CCMP2298]